MSSTLKNNIFRLLACALTLIFTTHAFSQKPVDSRTWFRREYVQAEVKIPVEVTPQADGNYAMLPIDFSRTNEFFCPLRAGWMKGCNELEVNVSYPADFPVETQLYFSGKDWDNLWYNYKADVPSVVAKSVSYRIPLFGTEARKLWVPGRHSRPWHQLTASQLREFGLKLEPPKGKTLDWSGTLVVTLRLHTDSNQPVEDTITNLHVNTKTLREGELFELAFEVPFLFDGPFDQSHVNLRGELTLPGGERTIIQCFYYEGFDFDTSDEFSKLIPSGHPQFRFRYTPSESGIYTVKIAGTVGDETISLPPMTFTVKAAPGEWKGFVQRMPDHTNLLSYSKTGEEFWGLGLNVRSPFDTRYQDVFPATKWEPYNLNMYKRLFKTYKENGISIVEVWMSSWWLALEWIPDAPGNHGIGHMNQWRAWQLDRLLEWAAEYDVHVILAIHNHGKFSSWCDEEWDRNPFNIVNGGYLLRPGDFFTNERAKRDYFRFVDYMVARWAHSPQILAWKLFTEIDLTGSKMNDYRSPSVAYWHRAAGRHIKTRDVYNHLVTTHWSTDVNKAKASPLLASSRELDILTLDAYYGGRHDLDKLYQNLVDTRAYQIQIRKPCIITEFGGTPWADSIPLIRQQLHFAMWYGYFAGFSAAPFLWWFPLIEEQDLYGQFKSLSHFTANEPRANSFMGKQTILNNSSPLVDFHQVRGQTRMLGWVVDRNFYLTNKKLFNPGPDVKGISVLLEGLVPGRYRVDFYDCDTGKMLEGKSTHFTNSTTLSVPTFRRDIAFKVTKVE